MPNGGRQVRQGVGRVLLHDRNTEDAPILGGYITLDNAHIDSVRNTEKKGITNTTRKEHCQHIHHFCVFLAEKYPEYANVGVRVLTGEDYANKSKFWYKCTHDIAYRGLNTDFSRRFYLQN